MAKTKGPVAKHAPEFIRLRRKELGLTQVQLAAAAGMSKSNVVRVQNEDIPLTPGSAQKIAKALGLPADAFFEETLVLRVGTAALLDSKPSPCSYLSDLILEEAEKDGLPKRVPILPGEIRIPCKLSEDAAHVLTGAGLDRSLITEYLLNHGSWEYQPGLSLGEYRRGAGYSQTEAAFGAAIPLVEYRAIERGVRELSPQRAKDLARLFGVTLRDILGLQVVASNAPERIRAIREERDLTARGLAALTGCSHTYVLLIERGDRPLKEDMARKFAVALDLPPDAFFEENP